MLPSKELRNLEGQAAVAKTKPFTTDVDVDQIRRLKIYCAVTGQTIKAVIGTLLAEKLPPLPRESEATA
jgi:hypothetical protein